MLYIFCSLVFSRTTKGISWMASVKDTGIYLSFKTPVSFPLDIQDMSYVVRCTGPEYPEKMEEKLLQHDIASYTAKRHQLVCWQASISVNWAVGGV